MGGFIETGFLVSGIIFSMRHFLFRNTISEIEKEIAEIDEWLRDNMEREALFRNSSDNWHSSNKTERFAKETTLGELRDLLANSCRLRLPHEFEVISAGCKAEVEGYAPSGSRTIWLHFGTAEDTRFLMKEFKNSNERIISVDTRIGKNLKGKRKGEVIPAGVFEYKILSIERSEFA